MGQRSAALADQFEQAVNELARTIEGCSDAQWSATCGDEGWTVAATAHHVAAQWPLEGEYLVAAAAGSTMPAYSWDEINERNARHAQEFTSVGKGDALRALRDGAPAMASWVRGLSDEQLDRQSPLPLANGAMVSTQQLIEGGVLIDHARSHTASIRAAG
jgi:hypothetical protein